MTHTTQHQIGLSLIVAMDAGRVIGANGGMPWHIPADLRWFKNRTRGKPVLMGRRTFEAIGEALPKRRNIVMSRQAGFTAAGCEIVHTIDEALARLVPAKDGDELMILGGADIFALALPRASRLVITHIEANYDGDTWFPEVDWSRWVAVDEQRLAPDDDTPGCRFVTYAPAAA